MKKISILSPLFLLLFLSCSTVRVIDTKAEEGFSLSEYQTFNFMERETGGDTILQEYQDEMNLIKEEIARELESRGLRRSEEPDLLVNIGAVVEEKTTTRETNIREAPRYIGQRRYSWRTEEIVVNRFQSGTVTVELVDNEQNTLVWKGVARGVVPEDQEKLRKNIEEGVNKLFSKIPATESPNSSS